MPDVLKDRLDALSSKLGALIPALDALGAKMAYAVVRFEATASRLAAVVTAALNVTATPPGSAPTASPTSATTPAPGGASPPPSQIATVGAAITAAMTGLNSTLSRLAAVVGQALAAKAPLPPAPGGATGAGLGAAVGGAVANPMGAFGSALGAVMGPVGAFVDGLASAAAKVRGFVEALNPSASLAFGRAMRDLQATIGVALQPVLQGLTRIVRDVANALLPLMERLAPVVKGFMDAFGAVFKVWINAVSGILSAFVPVLKVVADVFAAITPIVQGLYAAVSGVVAAISGVVGGILKIFGVDFENLTSAFRDAIQMMTKSLLVLAARVLKFFPGNVGNDFIDGVKRALVGDPSKKADGLAAPQNAAISNLQEFGRSVTRAALLAGPDGGKDKKSEEWLEDVVKTLDEIREDNRSALKQVLSAFASIAFGAADKVIAAQARPVYTPPTP